MAKDYIEKRDGAYWVAGTRVSLDSIVYAFLRGAAPENIAQSYSVLSLEEVYGAVAFYLANQIEIDAMLAANDREFGMLQRQTREANPALYKKMEEARQQFLTPRKWNSDFRLTPIWTKTMLLVCFDENRGSISEQPLQLACADWQI